MEETVGMSDTGLAEEWFRGLREPLFGSQTNTLPVKAAWVRKVYIQW